MQRAGDQDRDQLRKPAVSFQHVHILQAVHHQHSKHRRRQIFSDVLHEPRRLPVFLKDQKRQKPGQHRPGDAQSYGNHLLPNRHLAASIASNLFLDAASSNTITAMVGSMNESAPKQIQHTTAAATPTRDEIWLSSFSHCSRKMTTNMAVMTKLMPVVSNLSNDPTSPPTVAPETQYNWFSRVTKNINQPLSGISNFSHELRLGYVACTKHRHDNIKFRKGIRDLLLMIMLYDTGARIQELLKSAIFNSPNHVKVFGKGGKYRFIPVMPKTVGTVDLF